MSWDETNSVGRITLFREENDLEKNITAPFLRLKNLREMGVALFY